MKQAILAVSFGTSYPDTLENTIAATEQTLAGAFPDWEVRRAFTSDRIIKKLRQHDGLQIDNVTQAMDRLQAEGFTHVAVQPTYVVYGDEYEKLLAQLEPYRLRMQVSVGMPLLHAASDYTAVADALLIWLSRPQPDEALILVGHGTAHSANAAYTRLEDLLRAKDGRIWVAMVRGDPPLDSVKRKLAENPAIRKVTLVPLMLVAGHHARKDMADGAESWKKDGYEVRCVLQGLGQCPAIRTLFAAHCREAVAGLTDTITAKGGRI